MPTYSYPTSGPIRSRIRRRLWDTHAAPLSQRLRWCVGASLAVAATLALLASLRVLLSGGAVLDRLGWPYWQLLVWFAMGGLAGGLFFGLLQPLASSTLGRMSVWTLAFLPSQLLLTWSLVGPGEGRVAIAIALIAAGLYGCALTLPISDQGT